VWDYATALDQFVLQFPICHLPPLLHDVTRLRGGSFPVATPSARVLVAALRALVEVESESLDGAEELTYTLGDLLGSVVLRSSDRPAAPTEAKELALAMVRRTVAERFAEPDLTSTTLARLHNMSPRSLSALFAATGTSPAAYIRERRLEAARRRLLDPRWAGVTVAAVAARCGFLDTGTFTRAYRRAYGVLPSEDRAAAALAGAVSRS
jgi:AraC-like DNA-binding protein